MYNSEQLGYSVDSTQMRDSMQNMRGTVSESKPRVTVVGSMNIDRVWRVDTLPHAGETILAKETRLEFGGKGANQAVAAARHGAEVTLIGALGGDPEGERYLDKLRSEGIDASLVLRHPKIPTGAAHVYVDSKGANLIVVDLGANATLDPASLESALVPSLSTCDVLVLQLESPLATVLRAVALAAEHDLRTLLNASPYKAEFPWGTVPVDTAIVNEHECQQFFRKTPSQFQRLTETKRRSILESLKVAHLVITQGCEPTLFVTAGGVLPIPTHSVQAVDTVGAGDTFVGVLAARIAEGPGWPQALWYANIAAALSTQAIGAQSAVPTRKCVETVASAIAPLRAHLTAR